MIDAVIEKITARQGEQRTAVWMVGEQLKDICRREPKSAELVMQDLDIKEMSLAECEKRIRAFADSRKTGSFACVTPLEAEEIIREFYGLPKPAAAIEQPQERAGEAVIDLLSLL